MKEILKKISNHILLLFLGTMVGLVLLLVVHLLPTDAMRLHVYQSLPMIEREFLVENLMEEYPATFMGGFTDCLMMHHAIYETEEHSALEQLLYMYRSESGEGEGWAAGYSLIDYLEFKEQPREESYARYWHGYLVVLKPLLMLTTFNSIRVLAGILQMLLIGGVVAACGRTRKHKLGTAFLVAVPFLYYFSLYTSLSLSICFYVMTVALIVQINYFELLTKKGYMGAFFMIVGMATAYFDFLTYPLITLGFPLCVYLYCSKESTKKQLLGIVKNSTEWGVGYAGLWAMKWVLTDLLAVLHLVSGGGIIADGFSTIGQRTKGAESGSVIQGFFGVLRQNLDAYTNWGYYLFFFGIACWMLCMIIKKRGLINRERLAHASVFLIVALYPLGWFFFTQNHSVEHWVFTYKILSVTVFAGVCGVLELCGGEHEKKEDKMVDA